MTSNSVKHKGIPSPTATHNTPLTSKDTESHPTPVRQGKSMHGHSLQGAPVQPSRSEASPSYGATLSPAETVSKAAGGRNAIAASELAFMVSSTPRPTTLTVPENNILSPIVPPYLSSYWKEHPTQTIWVTPTPTTTPTSISSENAANPTTAPKHLSVVVAILISVGLVSLLLALVILFKCFFPKRRWRPPTPSAPIPQDSPLFGGKERSSYLWSSSFGNIAPSLSNRAGMGIGSEKGWKPLDERQQMFFQSEKQVENPFMDSYSSSQQAKQPMAPRPTEVVNTTLPLQVKRVPPKASRRQSVAPPANKRRESTVFEIIPPVEPVPTNALLSAPTYGNKERVKTPYLSTSGSRTLLPQSASQPNDDTFVYAIPTVKTEERRNRDTKALTSALGLASPPAPSAQFSPASLYPDEPTGERYSEAPSPGTTFAALGDYMLSDTALLSRSSSPGFTSPKIVVSDMSRTYTKAQDRPPRVPSPPLLPPLAQMSLANMGADYNYSIYGLYEAQRKISSKSPHEF